MTYITVMEAANVLLLPSNLYSHTLYFSRFGQALSQEGHSSTMVLASNMKVPGWLTNTAAVKIVHFPVEADQPFGGSREYSAMILKTAFSNSTMELIKTQRAMFDIMNQRQSDECESLLRSTDIVTSLARAKFDLAIVDGGGIICQFVLPYKLNIPYGILSIQFTGLLFRIPALPSFVPSILDTDGDSMSFMARVKNLMMEIVSFSYLPENNTFVEVHAPDKPALSQTELIQRSVFWFLLKDATLSYPSPSMPNTDEIGDLICQPAQRLPDDLQRFMDEAKDGVIIVALGAAFDHMPDEMGDKFCNALGKNRLKVLWKTRKAPLCDIPDNIKIMSWIPQNDVLAHTNTRLFLSHCGINSMIEAVHHAVPILGFPLALDQPFNADVMKRKGLGMVIHMRNFTAESLLEAMNKILESKEIAANMRRASEMMADKPVPASKRISFWVNHLTKHGADHLRTSAFELSHAQFLMLDIFLFIFAVLLIILLLVVCICYMCTKCVLRILCKSAKAKREWFFY